MGSAVASLKTRIYNMRYISEIILHSTKTTPDTELDEAALAALKHQGPDRPSSFHYLIKRDGAVIRTKTLSQPAAHCYMHNAHSVGIAYEGGLDADGRPSDTRTDEQRAALLQLVTKLLKIYRCKVVVHDEIDGEPCANIDPKEFAGILKQLRPPR